MEKFKEDVQTKDPRSRTDNEKKYMHAEDPTRISLDRSGIKWPHRTMGSGSL